MKQDLRNAFVCALREFDLEVEPRPGPTVPMATGVSGCADTRIFPLRYL